MPSSAKRGRLLLNGRAIGIVGSVCAEKRVAHVLIVTDRVQKALAGHITIVVTGQTERSHDALDWPVVVINLIFSVALLVNLVAPRVALFDGKMGARIEVESYRLISVVHDGHLVGWFLFCHRGTVVKKGHTGFG